MTDAFTFAPDDEPDVPFTPPGPNINPHPPPQNDIGDLAGDDYFPSDQPVPDLPTKDRDAPPVPINPYVDPDMPGGVPLVPGHPDTPVPVDPDEIPEE
jgi:hypothetical protein